MALLHLLRELAASRRLRLFAGHFDHGLRPESAVEAERVRAWADGLGIPCVVGRPAEPLRHTQNAFREARYAFLWAEARRRGADRLATGHQADDQAETVLFRALRGTGLRGLCGIPLRRGALVRPLLPFWRTELETYLSARGIDCLRDPSNLDRRWARARIRRDLLPGLGELLGEDPCPRLLGLARAARRAERALEARAAEVARTVCHPGSGGDGRVRIARSRLGSYDRDTQARVLRLLARRAGVELSRGGTRAAVAFITHGRSGTAIDLSETVRLGREFDALWLGSDPVAGPDREATIPGPSAGRDTVEIGGVRFELGWTARRGAAVREVSGQESGDWRVALSLASLDFPVRVRGPRPGDRIRMRGGTRKLKKLFNERRVPLGSRARTPVLVTADDRIVWVAGLAVGEGMYAGQDEGSLIIGLEEFERGIGGGGHGRR